MLVRLLYASRAVDTSAEAIEAILIQSRQHNPTCGITGILCYGGGIFLQAIEGGRMAVSDLFGHIQRRAPQGRGAAALRRNHRAPLWRLDHGAGQPVQAQPLHPAQVLRAPELDPYAVSGKVSLALLEELMATASIIGRA
jgi:hypothetical protein